MLVCFTKRHVTVRFETLNPTTHNHPRLLPAVAGQEAA